MEASGTRTVPQYQASLLAGVTMPRGVPSCSAIPPDLSNLRPISISGPLLLCVSCRVPALNTDKAFIKDMADMVVEALALPTLTVSEVRA